MENVASFIDFVQAQQRVCNTRRLLVLSGEQPWQADILRHCDTVPGTLWVSAKAQTWPVPATDRRVEGKQAHQVLGQEYPAIIFDSWHGFNPNGFGQVCGTLVAGGLMLLLTPPLAQWPDYCDPEYASLVTATGSVDQVGNRFIRHLISTLRSDDELILVEQGQPLPAVPQRDQRPVASVQLSPPFLSQDQQNIVEICTQDLDRPEQTTVITADRGRGKSAALGLIAAERMLKGGDVVVTAPGRGAVEPLFRAVQQRLSASLSESGGDRHSITTEQATLRFVLPDQLLAETDTDALLLVDEAAAIPAPLLRELLRFRQIIYASTIHGYEGTGQGFAVRFLSQLTERRPGWRHLRMNQPIRWAVNDPLEAFCYRALLLDAEPAMTDIADLTTLRYCRLDRDELVRQPERLAQIFGLLILAHYRTTPGDLRILLDSPNVQVWAALALVDGEWIPLATALLAEEGPIEPDLAAQIIAGQRRPKGQLIPQTLLAHSQLDDAARFRGLRIMRIAVQPGLQLQGIGSALIAAIEASMPACDYDWLGTSFGLTGGLLRFWQQQGLRLVRLGHKRDKVSATYAAVMLKGLNSAASALQQQASAQCYQYLTQAGVYDHAVPGRSVEPAQLIDQLLVRD